MNLADASRAAGIPHVIRWVEETGSTNDDLRALARAGAPHGTAILAGSQTAGRGRLGRQWVSPPGTALYLSVLIRPMQLAHGRLPLLTLGAAVAIAEIAPSLQIKWPNDVLDADGRKVAGVLAELESVIPPIVVIGVGVNVSAAPDVPGAGFLEADGVPRDRATLAAALVHGILGAAATIGRDPAPLLDRWRARSHTLGRRVRVDGKEGVAVDLGADGALVLLRDDGERIRVLAGDISMVDAFPDAGV